MRAQDGVTTANADMIGVNTASLMLFEEDSVTTSGVLAVGACALGLPAVVTTETNSIVEHVRAALFALSLDSVGSTGGTIENLVACRAVAIPNGITTVDRYIAYEADLPFGGLNADDSWGLHVSADIYNYMRGSLVIGSTQEKTTNSSVGLEVAGTTKAVLFPRLTSTQRNALTAVDGMVIYNTTSDHLQVRAGGTWQNLH
jgi:hypothetical protein